MSDRIIMRIGESLVAGGPPGTAAEPEVAIGEMDGPMGTAFANLLGNQVVGHSRVLALLNTDVMVRPPTICVSKVSVDNERYTSILMGTVQYATAMGVLDSVRSGVIPRDKARPHRFGVAQSIRRDGHQSRSQDPVRDPPQGDDARHHQSHAQRTLDRLAPREPGQGHSQVFREGPQGRDLGGWH
jgi:formaldehyde-activating enzyme